MAMKIKLWSDLTLDQKIARWSHAVDVIKGLTKHEIEKHFVMATWGEKTDCGTVGCAAGHCGLDPKFRRQGFKMNFDKRHEKYYDEDGVARFYTYYTVKLSTQVGSFFGHDAYHRVFVNRTLLGIKPGEKSHTAVVKAMETYLKVLKD